MTDDWRTTPEETILDILYESIPDDHPFSDVNLYGNTARRIEPVLYVEFNGVCYQITAKEHKHDHAKDS